MEASAFWVESPGHGVIREEALSAVGPDDVLVRTRFTGVSRGTETLVYRGQVPRSQHEAMMCPHQGGDFSFPVKYGYIAVGEIEGGSGQRGQMVFCLHPHQTRFVVSKTDVVPLPSGLSPGLAVLAPNLETAVTGVWDADIQPTDRVTVIGAGVVGLLVAWRVAREHGVSVELLDINPGRSAVAERLGVALIHPSQASQDRDVIIHASGSESGLQLALGLAGHEGRIIEMSWFGARAVTLALGEAFHSRRLTLRSSQVGSIPKSMQASWTHRTRMEMVLELLAAHPELETLISGESAFEDLPQTMAALAEGQGEVLCHRITYEEK